MRRVCFEAASCDIFSEQRLQFLYDTAGLLLMLDLAGPNTAVQPSKCTYENGKPLNLNLERQMGSDQEGKKISAYQRCF